MTKNTEKPTNYPYKRIIKGLAIRKVPQSKNWGIYLKLDGQKALQFSLKTSDQGEAEIRALKEYTNATALIENGYPLQQPKKRLSLHQIIDELISDYLEMQIKANKEKEARKGNEKYATEIRHWRRIKAFYDEKMLLKELTVREVRDYFLNIETPSNTQLGRIQFCFKNIFERALEYKLINKNDVVDLKNIKVEKKNIEDRDAFTPDEFHILFSYALTEYKTSGKGILHNKMCVFYVSFMYHAGLRSGEEMMGLKWSDLGVSVHNDLYCTVRKGKTEGGSKKNRNVILDLKANAQLLFVATLKHPSLIKNLNDNDALLCLKQNKSNEHIFATKYSETPDYRTTFNNWLKELREINYLPDTKNFVLYSMRHSYITNAIEKNIPLTLIAENAGTSVRMIENHYSHTSVMNEVSRKYLVSDKLEATKNEKPKKELTKEEIQTQKNELLDFVAKEFPL
ncbi:tyrosine-type recombinase/integrase [Moritella viscosa]|uniref:tyrosine-type recombinase/integrase n=1 Tax=Moritella viscosa TaxID=80854 RepID=UPI00091D2F99|nr:tyrosine-type recombinase/integrase [Moritella viscosa]SHO15741.1 Site-specific recombinase, phage integrase family protein [Moritella viscosa]SHO16092.1 Site-specific recombinase, phage integrase family protein [Moritella viscosa]SHO18823.1 Site-specific recombinase, phage integrase family protein [Moritella viscosa]